VLVLPQHCALLQSRQPDRKELVFTAFDPIRGKGQELARFGTDPNADYSWSLSPEGARIGITKIGGNHVYVLPLDGSPVRDLTVAGWNSLDTFDWSVDGRGFFSSNTTGLGSTLLFVDLNGKAHPYGNKNPALSPGVYHLRTAGIWPFLEQSSVATCG
jgi:hypothetical protein